MIPPAPQPRFPSSSSGMPTTPFAFSPRNQHPFSRYHLIFFSLPSCSLFMMTYGIGEYPFFLVSAQPFPCFLYSLDFMGSSRSRPFIRCKMGSAELASLIKSPSPPFLAAHSGMLYPPPFPVLLRLASKDRPEGAQIWFCAPLGSTETNHHRPGFCCGWISSVILFAALIRDILELRSSPAEFRPPFPAEKGERVTRFPLSSVKKGSFTSSSSSLRHS